MKGKKESPQPVVIRFYKNHLRTLDRIAKKSRVSRAAVARFAVDQLVIDKVENLIKS